ncbi:MAG: nitroreductase family protein [Nanoarchaeota archaeon]
MDLDDAIRARRSIREFSTKKPDWRLIIEAIDAARFAPTAGDNFTTKFLMVSDIEKISILAKATQQHFIGKVQYVVIVCSAPSRTINAYGEAGKAYVRQQAGAAIQNFLLKLTELGLGTCWVGYFSEEMIKEALKIPSDVQVEALFPIGLVLDKKKRIKNSIDLDNILYFEEYGNKRMKKINKLEV